jgi:hypothetical protein
MGKDIPKREKSRLEILKQPPWPGNVKNKVLYIIIVRCLVEYHDELLFNDWYTDASSTSSLLSIKSLQQELVRILPRNICHLT